MQVCDLGFIIDIIGGGVLVVDYGSMGWWWSGSVGVGCGDTGGVVKNGCGCGVWSNEVPLVRISCGKWVV